MRYMIKQKLFSIRDRFSIKNEMGEDVMYVISQLLTLGNKLRIYDMSDKELCYIEQKIFRFLPEYNIYIDGRHRANIKKRLTFFTKEFDIQSHLGTYSVQGNIFAYEFEILNKNRPVARISKKFFSLRDTYGVDVVEDENHVMILAIAIIMDMIFHNQNNN